MGGKSGMGDGATVTWKLKLLLEAEDFSAQPGVRTHGELGQQRVLENCRDWVAIFYWLYHVLTIFLLASEEAVTHTQIKDWGRSVP